MYEYFIVGRRNEKRRVWIEERHQAVYRSVYALIQDGTQRGEFCPSKPIDTITHWLVSFLDGIFLESIISGSERIQLEKQFELLQYVCKSILMPSSVEEKV
jgi:hypothetical protein